MDKKTSDLAKVIAEFGAEISILYVEDDEISREIIFKFLSHYFKEIEVAISGVEGLELYKKRGGFALVISTTYMPIMNGYEMCRAIREINDLQPIIITSQNSNSECLIKLIELGIDGFLLKPIDYKQFIKTLYKVCKNIYDDIMLNRYENMILDSNITLQQKNAELEEALFKLEREENKNIYLSEVIKNHKNIDDETLSFLTHKSEVLSALEFFEVYPLSLEDKEDGLDTILGEIDIGI